MRSSRAARANSSSDGDSSSDGEAPVADAQGSQSSSRRQRVAVRKVPASRRPQEKTFSDDFVQPHPRARKNPMPAVTRTTRRVGRPSAKAQQHAETSNNNEETANYPILRCSPGPMVNILGSMSQDMKKSLEQIGFKDFLGFNFGGIDERGLVYFLMDHVEMDPFRIEIDGRVLPLNREVVKFVLGIPDGPNALPVVSGLEKNNHKKEFRRLCESRGLRDMYNERKKMFPKRKDYSALNANEVYRWVVEEFAMKGNGDDWSVTCFSMALLDGILFPTTSVTLPGEIYRYCKVVGDVCQFDLCTAVIEDLKIKVGKWKKSSQKKTPSVQGCAILLLLYYLDNLHCPQHMVKIASQLPRAAHLTATIADKIAKADRKILRDGSVTYGNLPFRSKIGTCYENVRADDPPPPVVSPIKAAPLRWTMIMEEIVTSLALQLKGPNSLLRTMIMEGIATAHTLHMRGTNSLMKHMV